MRANPLHSPIRVSAASDSITAPTCTTIYSRQKTERVSDQAMGELYQAANWRCKLHDKLRLTLSARSGQNASARNGVGEGNNSDYQDGLASLYSLVMTPAI